MKIDASQWKTWLPIGLAVVVMGFAGWKQGVWSERWRTNPELELFSQQLLQVPLEFGEWKGTEEGQMDERIKKLSGAEGELIRVYRNASNEEVRVSLVCARLQDIFYHTPDRCYPAAGFEMQGEPQLEVFETGSGEAEFYTTSFLKSEPTGSHSERGYWSWSGDGDWVAPKNPKLRFGGQQWALYKLYVFANASNIKRGDRDYCKDFIREFVPVLQTALRPVMVQSGRIKSEASPESVPTG